MKQKLLFIALLICLLGTSKLMAQDKMLLRGKADTLQVKIMELGVDDVKYKMWPEDSSMPIMVEKKERIRKIIFANGTVMKFAEDEFSNAQNYASQRKMAVKIDLFSPIRKVFSGSFEYSIKPGMSVEGGIGIIGIGSYTSDAYNFTESDGGFFRLGVKFINQPDYHMKGMRYTHILKGGYIRPEAMFIHHENNGTSNFSLFGGSGTYNVNNKIVVNGGAFFINFGKQWVFSDIFCVDFFIGPGIGNKTVTYYENGKMVGSLSNSSNFGMADIYANSGGFGYGNFTSTSGKVSFCLQTGLKLGVLIGSNQK
ncbi:MAG: hypothetical protein CFE21_07225 [Bacteroidetes bacterium B1(2017)]|nr:MAG: hypothetical protein CFE21_07225 [Bacteroidetes bacterium B1(2017)]